MCIEDKAIQREKTSRIDDDDDDDEAGAVEEFSQRVDHSMMRKFSLVIFVLISSLKRFQTEHQPYKHYTRHVIDQPIYDNQTINEDDDGNMCQLTVRCPTIPTFCESTGMKFPL